jgi:pSer/pThr/pTyr-binding forkhead associated (FHA) protein
MHRDPQSQAHPGGVHSVAVPLETTANLPLVPDGESAPRAVSDLTVTLPHGVAMLIVAHGPNAGARFLLDRETTTAGRHPDSDIFLDDITVSRRHAVVRRLDRGYEVSDVGSLNGTYVDHERVDTAPLHHLADLQIGRYILVFLLGTGEAA